MGWRVTSESKIDVGVTFARENENNWEVVEIENDLNSEFYLMYFHRLPKNILEENFIEEVKEDVDRDFTIDKSPHEKRFDLKLLVSEIVKIRNDRFNLPYRNDRFKNLSGFLQKHNYPRKEKLEKQIEENRDETESRIMMK